MGTWLRPAAASCEVPQGCSGAHPVGKDESSHPVGKDKDAMAGFWKRRI
jgi:hypothetical protein